MKRTHFGLTRAQRQAAWLAKFSDAVVAADPRQAGRIDWDTARWMFTQGATPTAAAVRYVQLRAEVR